MIDYYPDYYDTRSDLGAIGGHVRDLRARVRVIFIKIGFSLGGKPMMDRLPAKRRQTREVVSFLRVRDE